MNKISEKTKKVFVRQSEVKFLRMECSVSLIQPWLTTYKSSFLSGKRTDFQTSLPSCYS